MAQQESRPQESYPQATPRATPLVTYKVIDAQWSPSDPIQSEIMLNSLGAQGWCLVTVCPDSRRERSRWVFSQIS